MAYCPSYVTSLFIGSIPRTKAYWYKHCEVLVSCSDREAVKSCHKLSKTDISCQKS